MTTALKARPRQISIEFDKDRRLVLRETERFLNSKNPESIMDAAQAAGMVLRNAGPEAEHFARLIADKALAHKKREVRIAGYFALIAIGKTAIDPLTEMLDHKDPGVREAAAHALTNIHEKPYGLLKKLGEAAAKELADDERKDLAIFGALHTAIKELKK
ncbi:MAG TPA: HEAT repeat domain-containing protein [Candidatus Norongarragalinales archaeon]|jgi:HEAT repeat protein|nr:HEAT repeat domain-containing protein [Candidatus Norongarragalinales archaeon]